MIDTENTEELSHLVRVFEKIEQVRVSESVRLSHLARRVRCLACGTFWIPTKGKKTEGQTACPQCGSEEREAAPVKQPFLSDVILPKLEELEEIAENEVCRHVRPHPVWTSWAKQVKGLGETSVGYLLGKCDMQRLPTATAMWAHCGFGLKNGIPQKRRKGEKVDFDLQLKGRCTVIGECLIRVTGPYYRLYLKEKGRATGIGLTKGHAHNRAFRHMIKLMLSHFWEVARRAEGLETPRPYAIQYLGHTGYIGPEEMTGQ